MNLRFLKQYLTQYTQGGRLMAGVPEGKNVGLIIPEIESAIEDFMDEPIGFKKILQLDILERVLKEFREKNNLHDPSLNYGIADVWYRIWLHDESWIEKYLHELEVRIDAANSKAELGMLWSLLPYKSGNNFKDQIDKLNAIIYQKMQS